MHGRWPHLRLLKLGDCSMANEESFRKFEHESPFMRFLAAHPTLDTVCLPTLSSFPRVLTLPPSGLPRLRTFAGNPSHLDGLPDLSALSSLSLVYQPLTVEMLVNVCAAVKKMPALTSLSIWLHADTCVDHDHYIIIRYMLNCCPRLSHLDLACSEAAFDIVSICPLFPLLVSDRSHH